MDYLSIYRKVVQKQNEEALLHLFKETGHWDKLHAITLEIRDEMTLPYILITVDYQKEILGYFVGAMIGVTFDKACIRDIHPPYRDDYFYLPVIVIPQTYPDIAKEYYSEEHSIAHELIHIADILQWIDDEPTYIDHVLQYGHETVTEDTLGSSIDFEVQKIFKLEPRAMGNDFENGEDMIIEPFLFGVSMKYQCQTKTEYIEIKMADYITNLKEMYVKKFQHRKETIEHLFKESIEKYGKTIFGHTPYTTLQKVHTEKAVKMLEYSMKHATKS